METLKVLSPYDEGCIGELNLVGAAEIETMLSTAHSLFSDGHVGYLKETV